MVAGLSSRASRNSHSDAGYGQRKNSHHDQVLARKARGEPLGMRAQFGGGCRLPVVRAKHRTEVEKVRSGPAVRIDDDSLRSRAQS